MSDLRRLPFEVTCYDADLKPQSFVAWLEIDETEIQCVSGWDWAAAVERIAKDDICANVEVSLHVESLSKPAPAAK